MNDVKQVNQSIASYRCVHLHRLALMLWAGAETYTNFRIWRERPPNTSPPSTDVKV